MSDEFNYQSEELNYPSEDFTYPSDMRGEKVPYQPVQPVQPVQPTPKPTKPYHKYEFESSPESEWEIEHYKHGHHRRMLKTLHRAMTTSERMIQFFMSVSTVHQRTRQIRLLNECSDACATAIRYVSRNSPFSGRILKTCARVCETYHRECSRYPDPESQMSAQVLWKCGQECRNYASMFREEW